VPIWTCGIEQRAETGKVSRMLIVVDKAPDAYRHR
jgi:hypothetical protein